MANNRMYLTCKHCKKLIRIAKYYPSTGYYTEKDKFGQRFEMFLDKHWPCSQIDEQNFELKYQFGSSEKELPADYENDQEVTDLKFSWDNEQKEGGEG